MYRRGNGCGLDPEFALTFAIDWKQFCRLLAVLTVFGAAAAQAVPPSPLVEGVPYAIRGKGASALLNVDSSDELLSSRTVVSDRSATFVLESAGDGSYRIFVRSTRRYLEEDGEGDQFVSTRSQPSDDSTHFYMELQPDDSYKVRVKSSNRYWQHDGPGDKIVSTRTQTDNDYLRFYFERIRFADVPDGAFYSTAADRLAGAGVTDGCGAGGTMYCPDDPTTRGQMAVFLVRALLGSDEFEFPTTPYFTDVPVTHPFFKWIQKLRQLAITSGCALDRYCPDDSVTRGQMAVFVIRARYGAATAFPYSASPLFGDVPFSHPYFRWIQRLRADEITSGCGGTSYCPDDLVTRGQMAVFIVRGLFNELMASTAPRITSVSPSELQPGETQVVSIALSDLDGASPAGVLTLGEGLFTPGISTRSTGLVTATVTASFDAPLGPISVSVRVGDQIATAPGGITVAGPVFETRLGTDLGLSDDGSALRALPFPFPFFGETYTDVYINNNGNLTFGSPDSDWSETMNELADLPRISPLWDDLRNGGTIAGSGAYVNDTIPGRFVVTWSNIQEFLSFGDNSIQVILYRDGRIQFGYDGVTSQDGIVAINPGPGVDGNIPLDFSTLPGLLLIGQNSFSEQFQVEMPGGSTDPPGAGLGTPENPFDLDRAFVLFRRVPFTERYEVGTRLPEPPILVGDISGMVLSASDEPVQTGADGEAPVLLQATSSGDVTFARQVSAGTGGQFMFRDVPYGGVTITATRGGQQIGAWSGVVEGPGGATGIEVKPPAAAQAIKTE